MQLQLENELNQHRIQAYTSSSIEINDKTYHHAIIVTPTTIVEPSYQSLAQLTETDMLSLLNYQADVILLGTGSRITFPPASWLSKIQQQGVGIEVMDTGAACRTFNVLISESRQALALLLLDN